MGTDRQTDCKKGIDTQIPKTCELRDAEKRDTLGVNVSLDSPLVFNACISKAMIAIKKLSTNKMCKISRATFL